MPCPTLTQNQKEYSNHRFLDSPTVEYNDTKMTIILYSYLSLEYSMHYGTLKNKNSILYIFINDMEKVHIKSIPYIFNTLND